MRILGQILTTIGEEPQSLLLLTLTVFRDRVGAGAPTRAPTLSLLSGEKGAPREERIP